MWYQKLRQRVCWSEIKGLANCALSPGLLGADDSIYTYQPLPSSVSKGKIEEKHTIQILLHIVFYWNSRDEWSLRVPVVWSLVGPVSAVPVGPWARVQLNWSPPTTCVHWHKPFSKLQSYTVGAEGKSQTEDVKSKHTRKFKNAWTHTNDHVFSFWLWWLSSPGVATAAVVVLTGWGVVLCMAGLALLGCTKTQIQISVSSFLWNNYRYDSFFLT